MRLVGFGQSSLGPGRQHNEDYVGCDPNLGFFAVADGMGNGRNGAVASQLATDWVYGKVRSLLADDVLRRNTFEARDRLQHGLPAFMNEASEAVFRRAQTDSTCRGIATTFSLVQVVGELGVVGHIGDSRVYLIRGDQSYQLTEDHTLAQELLRSGSLAPEAVASFPHKNVLSRALGKSPAVEVDIMIVDVVPGDRFVVCSDGLSDHVQANEIVTAVTRQTPHLAVPALMALATERGARDDISVIVVEVHGEVSRPTTLPTQEKAGLLGQIFLCKDLSFQELVRVLAVVQERRVPRGATIVREGDVGDVIYLLAVGGAEVSRRGLHRKVLSVGDHFGELALIGSGHHTITVTASSDSVLLTLAKADLYNLVRSDHGIAIKLFWGLVTKLGETVEEQAAEITRLRGRG